MATKHQRQAIREAVAKQLRFKTEARERVFETRMVPWGTKDLPGISVYALEEVSERSNLDGDLQRDLTLEVQAVVSLTEGVDDALDSIAAEIETAMATDETFGGAAEDSRLTATAIELSEDQGRPVGGARLTYTVRYYS